LEGDSVKLSVKLSTQGQTKLGHHGMKIYISSPQSLKTNLGSNMSNTRIVFHQDMRTPRSELKKRGAPELLKPLIIPGENQSKSSQNFMHI